MQSTQDGSAEARKAVLDTLAGAPAAALAQCWDSWSDKPEYRRLRGPETGLVMIRGRAGGGGAPFNLGEATVSRASVRIASGETGHGYCLGRDLGKAEAIALIDALWQRQPEAIEAAIVAPLRAQAQAADQKRREETAATRVDFFTMVRGDN
jgi:alpha-D-ribose 1-methylphosphonate 5-triphosphate synthase subunit PhnG